MNERIKELAEQAGYDIKPFYKGEDNFQTPHFKDEKLEKFAELIVRECASVNYNSAFNDGEFCAREVLEHFGFDK